MIRRIKTKTEQLDVVDTIGDDLLLVLSAFISGFAVPFLVWLWAIILLSQTVLAQVS